MPLPIPCALLLLAALPAPVRVVELEGDTFHVQGVLVEGATAWVTSVDRAAQKGWLFEYDIESGKRRRAVEIHQGPLYHPGGLDADEDSLWIPVAEYKPRSRTIVQKRLKHSLELLSTFEFNDHLGAIAVSPSRLYAANWDARLIYEFTPSGELIRARPNPTPWRYQDMKYRHGSIAASAVAPRGASHSIVWLDPESLKPIQTIPAGFTDRIVPFTNEGLDSRDGLLYLLPEDAPSRLFVFHPLNL